MSALIAYQGEPGAYSQQACRQFFGDDVQTEGYRSFNEMFTAVQEGDAEHMMLPVENSLAGTVIPAYDLLVDHDLRVQGEEYVHVKHCLMAPAGTAIHDLIQVKSHPQALAQCAGMITKMGVEPVTWYDTAGAARDLSISQEPYTAAIASELAAETYGLTILSRDLQDIHRNFTRMLVLGKKDVARQESSKTSIMFTTRHASGALYKVLGELVERDFNLTKIESRPRRHIPWSYRFFVDFDGHEDDPLVRDALIGILKKSSSLKVLGSYPAKKIDKSSLFL